ncbi:NUDIX domain-containing protein [Pelagibacteraceae bacterium]|nr:NUDIX domain-containing protein [Pelagibacteraceae bacterium]
MSSKFKIVSKKNLYNGFFKMNEVVLKYKKYDGTWTNKISRELFGGAQVSAVLPYDPLKKEIILIQQFRPGTISKNFDNYLNEIVAGIIDDGESPEDAAKRECVEETGCVIKKLIPIQGYFPAPGSSESFYHLFLGETETFNGTRIMGLENENEDIKVQSFKTSEIREKMQKGQILNGLTLIALQWFFLNIKEN